MQNRMKKYQLSFEEIRRLLEEENVGRFATVSPEGRPYAVPVHFVWFNEKIYIHGLLKGQKTDYLASNPAVCFEVDRFETLLMPAEDVPCKVSTQYQSVILTGTAKVVDNEALKITALNKIVEKYTPLLSGNPLSDSIHATAVIEMTPEEITGKYYRDEASEFNEVVFE